MAGLTPKQEAFAMAYVETGNASEAYRRSYNAEKMKPETVNRTAKEQLDNPKIAARLAELKAAHVERHEITVDDLIRELEPDRLAKPRILGRRRNGSEHGRRERTHDREAHAGRSRPPERGPPSAAAGGSFRSRRRPSGHRLRQ